MSLWSRLGRTFRGDLVSREIEEEQQAHIADAIAQGRDPAEARRAFGPALRRREESRDLRLLPWLDALRADVVFGCRQLRKRKVTSAAAALSLALGIGACTAAFRLIDALLLRPLPVAHPEQLFALSRTGIGPEGTPQFHDSWAYPPFRLMRAAVKGQAELTAVSYAERMDLTYGADADMEKAYVQYVSGWMFRDFGLQPAVGRLFTERDDVTPGAHPYAVLSYDYWTRRFGRDARVIGRTFRLGATAFQIVGVSGDGFTGIEPGTITDVFVPAMMNSLVTRDDSTWIRSIARLAPGVAAEPLRQKLAATSRAFEEERAKGFTHIPFRNIANFLGQRLTLEPAFAGVSGDGFTGIEPGTITDVFVPAMMNSLVTRDDSTWIRSIARVAPGVALEPLRQKLGATSRAFEEQRAKGFTHIPFRNIGNFLDQRLTLEPALAGVSGMQRSYRESLAALAAVVGLVLLIACANVANLLIANATGRAREMALRVSIGAGRGRLVQLVLVESALLAMLGAAGGAVFAWWSAPFVLARINPPDSPARLVLPFDWRVAGFGLALTLAVTILFGLAPALRASSVRPVSALKGGDPHSRQRLMKALIAVQVAFCFVVLFVGGLFTATLDHLAKRPTGFSAERLLAVDTVSSPPQPAVYWEGVAAHLREQPGVEAVAMAGWPLVSGTQSNSFVALEGKDLETLAYFLNVSPGFLDAMKIPLLDGRDFRLGDTNSTAAIVNQAFAKLYFHGESPVGKFFERTANHVRLQVVGLMRDAAYRNIREPAIAVAYVPFELSGGTGASTPVRPIGRATLLVRTTAANPMIAAPMLRREVARARPGFRVSNVRTQEEIDLRHTIRERLLAALALFFAAVALLLASVGLYGVLDYSVLQRRREIGVRMAIGARPAHIARGVTGDVFAMVLIGAVAGLALGAASARYIAALLYQVKATDPAMLGVPVVAILGASIVAALPAVMRAVRIDPATMLRME